MSESVIDLATFNSLKEIGGAEFIKELIDTFLDDAPTMFEQMQTALAALDADSFRRAAHSLKSNANTFGATQLAVLAKELEFIGRDNKLNTVGTKLDSLSAEYAKVESVLKGMRNA
jgi:HPt (histidine-containing phosphotransfer) domain-containing protein